MKNWASEELGKPLDFVLEITSPTNRETDPATTSRPEGSDGAEFYVGREDYTAKRSDYANFGIPEYWRFDSSGGRYHGATLGGDRLVEGAYQPVELLELGQDHLHGHSEVLNLDLCWENGRLRWWDPAAQRYLMTIDETDEARANAEARADCEHEARTTAEARIRQLEAELKGYRGA